MKQYIFFICVAAIGFGSIVCWRWGCMVGQSCIYSRSFNVTLDPVFSVQQKKKIKQFISENQDFKRQSLFTSSLSIRDRFPAIKRCIMRSDSFGITHINCSCIEPRVLFNEKIVLSVDGRMFEQDLFSKSVLKKLIRVDLTDFDPSMCSLPASCIKNITTLPSAVFEQFKVVWQTSTRSVLYDKADERFTIIFNDACVPDSRLLGHYIIIKNKILSDDSQLSGGQQIQWVMDMRFDNQIILSKT
jgi:hypothetical protein